MISRTCLSSSAHYESQEQLVFIAWAVHKDLKKTQQPKRALQLINALLPAAMGEDVTQISKAKELLQLWSGRSSMTTTSR